MTQKPHEIGLKEVTDSIYDKLMNNTSSKLDIADCDFGETDSAVGEMYFDFETEKGDRRVHVQIEIEDKDDEE